MPIDPSRQGFRRCLAVGLAAFLGAVGAEVSVGDGFAIDARPISSPLIERAIAAVAPELPLVQVGKWIGKSVLAKSRASERPTRCG